MRKHTIMYWYEDGGPPYPFTLLMDNHRDALRVVNEWLEDPSDRLRWVKVFRVDNEAYTCFRWSSPVPLPPEPAPPVAVEPPRKKRRWRRGR